MIYHRAATTVHNRPSPPAASPSPALGPNASRKAARQRASPTPRAGPRLLLAGLLACDLSERGQCFAAGLVLEQVRQVLEHVPAGQLPGFAVAPARDPLRGDVVVGLRECDVRAGRAQHSPGEPYGMDTAGVHRQLSGRQPPEGNVRAAAEHAGSSTSPGRHPGARAAVDADHLVVAPRRRVRVRRWSEASDVERDSERKAVDQILEAGGEGGSRRGGCATQAGISPP